jgi:exopolysaccharide biosynthesis protein
MNLLLFLLLSAFVLCFSDTVIYQQAPPPSDDPGISYERLILHTERQANIRAVLTTIKSPVGHVHPFPSHVDGCTGREELPKIAETFNCKLALNGAPFDMNTGACLGNLIGNGTTYQIEGDDEVYANWGLTKDGRHVFGDIGPTTIDNDEITELLSGFVSSPLLVTDGVPITGGGDLVAQRQGLGTDSEGKLLFITIDGAENNRNGMTIEEFAAAFASAGAKYAVNLDGGGSTATWMDGEYLNHPTCTDHLAPKCDRAVANIVCVTA